MINITSRSLITCLLYFFFVPASYADNDQPDCGMVVSAKFRESAPRDFFNIDNQSEGDWMIADITIDLSQSVGQLIFDTEAGGKGVEVFQLFDVEQGTAVLGKAELPADGASSLKLYFTQFSAGQNFSFSIDVDDQLANSELGQIRVSGSEIAGSVLAVNMVNDAGEKRIQQLQFTQKSVSEIVKSGCQGG